MLFRKVSTIIGGALLIISIAALITGGSLGRVVPERYELSTLQSTPENPLLNAPEEEPVETEKITRIPAEFEALDYVILSYTGNNPEFYDFIRQLLPVTKVLLIKDNGISDERLFADLEKHSIPTDDQNLFIKEYPIDTYWVRDYGPMLILKDGKPTIVDFSYKTRNINRQQDDSIPYLLSEELNTEYLSTDIRLLLGNFMTDGRGNCYSSTSLYEEAVTDELSESDIDDFFHSIGCDTIRTLTKLEDERTTHIDMFAKFVNENTVIVASMENDTNTNILDENARQFEEWGYKVVRIPIPQRWLTYINLLLVNGHAFIPSYRASEEELGVLEEQIGQTFRDLGLVPHFI
ncbi:MAG: agmatine deiminase family protein, partial [Candidatus Gracilibacteria bacterium]|nr:agmatine deiminase family protein [Candidatus Gracilibacteria bacterium]